MKIGVLSDSHHKTDALEKTLNFLKNNGAEFLIHAGDICSKEALDILAAASLRYIVVYGNNDAQLIQYNAQYNLVKEPHYFKLANTKFKLMHLPFYMNGDVEIVIFGHTHKFACDFTNSTLFLNPGEVCAREKPLHESVILEITDKELIVQYFTNYTLSQTFTFQRGK